MTIGQIASTIVETDGLKGLQKFSDEIYEATGTRIAYQTLRNYKWVWEKTYEYNFSNLNFRTLQKIASDNPKKWAKKIARGMSEEKINKKLSG